MAIRSTNQQINFETLKQVWWYLRVSFQKEFKNTTYIICLFDVDDSEVAWIRIHKWLNPRLHLGSKINRNISCPTVIGQDLEMFRQQSFNKINLNSSSWKSTRVNCYNLIVAKSLHSNYTPLCGSDIGSTDQGTQSDRRHDWHYAKSML